MRRIQQLKDYGLSLAEISKLFELARGDRSGGKVKRSLLDFYRQKLAEAERKRESLDAYIQELDWHVQQLERVEDFFQCPGAACRDCAFSARCDMKALAPGSREAH
jgi:DNA-binding transcriptional MerR regulator